MSTLEIGLIGPGRMGTALARRLGDQGARVRCDLAGRGAESLARAEAAGIQPCSAAEVAEATLVLSVVPPGQALAAAEAFADTLRHTKGAPVYIDLNAINPDTALKVGETVAAAGARFVDGCIVGTEPRDGFGGPWIHVSGPDRDAAMRLGDFGLNMLSLDGPNGAASALKMSFAAVMKGLQALGAASYLAASRVGAEQALMAELERSQPELKHWLEERIARMYPKTYRWVAEMQEIADFAGPELGGGMFTGAAELFAWLSAEGDDAKQRLDALKAAFPPRAWGEDGDGKG
jgi:3-hydroxyisobutyrate dehydrogenase-like beta-hydroxyacid dehydrogenase